MSRLVLGTAQFGSPYGVTNEHGHLSDDVVRDILRIATQAGHDLIDTSPAYGTAQERLGALAPGHMSFVSKFVLPDSGDPTRRDAIDSALAALRVDRLHGMLFHSVADLGDERAPTAIRMLRDARDNGLVARIGVSVYDAADLEMALAVFADLDMVQVPGSIVDRRLLDSGLLQRIHDAGVEVHVRSAYLQGALVVDPEHLPASLVSLGPHLTTLRDAVAAEQTTVLSAALRFVRDHPVVDAVVIGAAAAVEFEATVEAWRDPAPPPAFADPGLSAEVLDPRSWPRRTW